MRARYWFLEWTLPADPRVGLRYVGKCLLCAEFCVDTVSADEAQVWCLKRAGATGHTRYGLSAFQYFTAALTDPAAGGAP
ncbi:hypothetical protein ACFY12_04605 [Streptomyces sp. NPDC001339]|uniref:DUF7848 domain-containing protein n=1 Tax=Streptomyces sp. NPDC001339 TaxID=3364563 RepID=UPI0036BE446B